jgi:hypothetical protein
MECRLLYAVLYDVKHSSRCSAVLCEHLSTVWSAVQCAADLSSVCNIALCEPELSAQMCILRSRALFVVLYNVKQSSLCNAQCVKRALCAVLY